MKKAEFIPNLEGNKVSFDGRDYSIRKFWSMGQGISGVPESYEAPNATKKGSHNQRKTPSCGAHAVAHYKESLDGVTEKKAYSPRFLWAITRLKDGWNPEYGSDIRTVMGALRDLGIASEKLAPNDSTLSNADYAKLDITSKMYEEAKAHKVGIYTLDYDLTFDEIKKAIYQNNGAVLLLKTGTEWFTDRFGNSTWAEEHLVPLRPLETPTGSHYIYAYGYDKDYIYFKNSWSDNWADEGCNYFGKNIMPQLQLVATMMNADEQIKKLMQLKSYLEILVTLYKQLVALKK